MALPNFRVCRLYCDDCHCYCMCRVLSSNKVQTRTAPPHHIFSQRKNRKDKPCSHAHLQLLRPCTPAQSWLRTSHQPMHEVSKETIFMTGFSELHSHKFHSVRFCLSVHTLALWTMEHSSIKELQAHIVQDCCLKPLCLQA